MSDAPADQLEHVPFLEQGPAYRLFSRVPMAPSRRIILLVAIAWIPLALLSRLTPQETMTVTFFADLVVQIRLLLALPIYLLCVPFIERGIQYTVSELLQRDIVRDRDAYASVIRTTQRLLDSKITDAVLALLAFARSFVYFRVHPGSAWLGIHPASSPTPAGWWFAVVSLPIVYFVTWWWLWRILVWVYFLGSVARLKLNLIATHPDRAGGIGFLTATQSRFAYLASGGSTVISADVAMLILVRGYKLEDFQILIPLIIVVLVALVIAPLFFFSNQLLTCARAGKRLYGRLGTEYVRDFEGKWIAGKRGGDPLLGSADIQSLADLANSYQVVSEMRMVPLRRADAIQLIATITAPYVPLLLTILPAKELLKLVLSILK